MNLDVYNTHSYNTRSFIFLFFLILLFYFPEFGLYPSDFYFSPSLKMNLLLIYKKESLLASCFLFDVLSTRGGCIICLVNLGMFMLSNFKLSVNSLQSYSLSTTLILEGTLIS